MFGFKREEEKVVPESWHDMRESAWNDFIKTCERFDYVRFKNSRAVAFMRSELPELQERPKGQVVDGQTFFLSIEKGTCIMIPFEMVKVRYE